MPAKRRSCCSGSMSCADSSALFQATCTQSNISTSAIVLCAGRAPDMLCQADSTPAVFGWRRIRGYVVGTAAMRCELALVLLQVPSMRYVQGVPCASAWLRLLLRQHLHSCMLQAWEQLCWETADTLCCAWHCSAADTALRLRAGHWGAPVRSTIAPTSMPSCRSKAACQTHPTADTG